MNPPLNPDGQFGSTRPYLVRALHDWCTDNGFTPYLAVQVDETVQVPLEYVKNGEIVLNVSFDATSGLKLGNDFVEFKARFGGVARDIVVPVDHVIAIYARENGQGMAFPAPPARHPANPPEPESAPGPNRTAPAPLRLAPREASEPARPLKRGAAGASLKPVGDPATTPEPPPAEPPPSPPEGSPPAAGGRPALKRVK